MFAGALAMAGAAWAAPPGVTEKDGAFVAPDGKPLYTFARDTTPGKSACNAQCAANWPALAAAADAKDDGDWTRRHPRRRLEDVGLQGQAALHLRPRHRRRRRDRRFGQLAARHEVNSTI